jgi:hypothetical protein
MSVNVEATMHRGLGRMIRLALPSRAALLLTPWEALTLSQALAAVADGRSRVNELFLSPIASDGEFHADIGEAGMVLAGDAPVALDWQAVGVLATALAREADAESTGLPSAITVVPPTENVWQSMRDNWLSKHAFQSHHGTHRQWGPSPGMPRLARGAGLAD